MFSHFYNFVLFFFLIFSFPKFAYQLLFHKKYRQSLKWRLGLKAFKIDIPKNRKIIWIHAVSLGEAKAGLVLLESLKKYFTDSFIVFSTVTQTGQDLVKKSDLVDLPIYLPLDFSWIMKRLLKKIKPDTVILIETDFWYHFLKYAKKNKAKVFLVSGILSERSAKRLRRVPSFSKRLFSLIDFFCLQDQLYLARYLSLGISANKLKVCGNLKYDQKVKRLSLKEEDFWRKKWGIENNDQVITVASTHEKEEELILKALFPLLEKFALKILIAPRHPERFGSVLKLLEKKYNHSKITLIDQMGMLSTCYQISHLAILGGSFIPTVGGHNILEPGLYHLPVFFGPYMHSQKQLEKLVLEYESGWQMPSDRLSKKTTDFLSQEKIRQKMRENILSMKSFITGSLAKTTKALIQEW